MHKTPTSDVLLFVKAAKLVAFAMVFVPITGCAIATGLIYSALVNATAFAPETEDMVFNYASLGFAFVETFAFFLLFAAVFIISL